MSGNETLVTNLRAAADFVEAHPDLPTPTFVFNELSWGCYNNDDSASGMAAIVRAIGGRWDKNVDDEYYRLRRTYGALKLQVWAYRQEVCERVVTGTREVTTDKPTAFEQVTETVEDFEWVCKPILAEAAEAAESEAVA